MTKALRMILVVAIALSFNMCGKKQPKVTPTKQQPVGVERVEEKTPLVQRPTMSEEELFLQKSIEQLNREGVLKRIHFDFDKYFIREDMKPILQANADWIMKHKTLQILIEGHCDERGTEEYNIALGEKRAEASKNYLVSLGVAAANVKTISYGKSRPLVKGVDEATWFQNRRDEFIIVGK